MLKEGRINETVYWNCSGSFGEYVIYFQSSEIGLQRADSNHATRGLGDQGQYDVFVQSTSVNRKLIAGTEVVYWPKVRY